MSHFAVHVISLGTIVVQPGRKIPDGLLTPKEVQRLLEKGAIVEHTWKPVEVAAPVQEANQQNSDPAAWAFDPKVLEGKSIETLNMMIVEHVKKHGIAAVPVFEELEDALFWMTKDRK